MKKICAVAFSLLLGFSAMAYGSYGPDNQWHDIHSDGKIVFVFPEKNLTYDNLFGNAVLCKVYVKPTELREKDVVDYDLQMENYIPEYRAQTSTSGTINVKDYGLFYGKTYDHGAAVAIFSFHKRPENPNAVVKVLCMPESFHNASISHKLG